MLEFRNRLKVIYIVAFEMTGNSKTNFDSLKRNDRKFPLPPLSGESPQVTPQSSVWMDGWIDGWMLIG